MLHCIESISTKLSLLCWEQQQLTIHPGPHMGEASAVLASTTTAATPTYGIDVGAEGVWVL